MQSKAPSSPLSFSLGLALSLSMLLSIPARAADQTDNSAAAKTDSAATEQKASSKATDTRAEQLLKKMSQFYSGLKSFQSVLEYNFNVRKGSEKESRKTSFKILASKPNKLSISLASSDQDRFNGGEVRMDGANRYLYNPRRGYIKTKATENFLESFRDRQFAYATGFNFAGLNFLESLLSDDPYEFMQKVYGVKSTSYVGSEKINGVDCDHILVQSPKLAWDVWIDSGAQPWLRRIAPALGDIQGDQTLSITFDYTNPSDKKIADSEFKFVPPKASVEIETFFENKPPAVHAAESEEHPLLKTAAPQIVLNTLDGGKFDLAALKDKNVVVLDFWATWCPPCRQALPILAEVTKAYEAKGVKFFAIDLREEPSKIEAFLKAQGLSINVALDKDGKVAEAYKVEGIPQSVIVGKDGLVKVVHVGFSGDLKERLTNELDTILKQQ